MATTRTVQMWFAGVTVAYLVWRAATKKKLALRPRQDQIMALFDQAPAQGKITMLNLIKFRGRAVYEDGRSSELSGAEAYDLYDMMNRKLVEACGGIVLFCGDAKTLVIGYGSEADFDRVVITQFPSMEAYNMVAGECMRCQGETGFQDHQFAAIEHQQLVRTDAVNGTQ